MLLLASCVCISVESVVVGNIIMQHCTAGLSNYLVPRLIVFPGWRLQFSIVLINADARTGWPVSSGPLGPPPFSPCPISPTIYSGFPSRAGWAVWSFGDLAWCGDCDEMWTEIPKATGWRPSVADWGDGVSASCTMCPIVRQRGRWMAT